MAQLRLRYNLELTLFSRLQKLIHRFIRNQARALESNLYFPYRANVEFSDKLKDLLRMHYRRVFLSIYERNSNVLSNLAQKQEAFDFSNVDFEQLVNGYIANHELVLSGISTTLSKRLTRIIEDGMAEGLTLRQIAGKLRDSSITLSRARAYTIARTETHNAASWANHKYHVEIRDNLDIELVKKWVAVSDGRTRPEHRAANGQTVPMDGKFVLTHPKLGEVQMDRAGDEAGGIYHTINCRCVIVYEDAEQTV